MISEFSMISVFIKFSFFQLSVADFNTYNYIEFFGIEYLLDKFPKVAESCKQVKADKNIAKYLQERPANIFHPDIGP